MLVLDPPTLQCKLQWPISQKMISCYNFWLECPTKVRSTQLSYIFKALFRDTPLAYNFFHTTCHLPPVTWPPGTWNAIFFQNSDTWGPLGQGSLFLVYRGETSLLKTPYFQQTYKKLSQFYKNLRSDMLRSPPNLTQHKGLRRLKCHLTTNSQTNKQERYQLQHS